jgi:hypothetical protein
MYKENTYTYIHTTHAPSGLHHRSHDANITPPTDAQTTT